MMNSSIDLNNMNEKKANRSENWNLRANKNEIMERKILFYEENIINGKQASSSKKMKIFS